jgi:hypothetical protein
MDAIQIDGVCYRVDMDNLMKWVSETPSNEKNILTTTTLNYPNMGEDENELIEKEISESKALLNDTLNNVRYDIVRTMINTLFSNERENMSGVSNNTLRDMSIGQKIAFNTLLYKNIIVRITD